MQTTKLTIAILTILTLGACGGGGSDDSAVESDPSNNGGSFDGIYSVTVSPDTAVGSSGQPCFGATGNMSVDGSQITGVMVLTNSPTRYNVNGTVSSTGRVAGSGTLIEAVAGVPAGTVASTMEGQITGGNSQGTFSDVFGCRGSWSGSR